MMKTPSASRLGGRPWPGAGRYGGEVIYAGEVAGLLKSPDSLTGQYLRVTFVSQRLPIAVKM